MFLYAVKDPASLRYDAGELWVDDARDAKLYRSYVEARRNLALIGEEGLVVVKLKLTPVKTIKT